MSLAVQSFEPVAYNLTQEEAKSRVDEIYKQEVEGERITRAYAVECEPHEGNPEECDACQDLIVDILREELGAPKRETTASKGD